MFFILKGQCEPPPSPKNNTTKIYDRAPPLLNLNSGDATVLVCY